MFLKLPKFTVLVFYMAKDNSFMEKKIKSRYDYSVVSILLKLLPNNL